MFTYALNLALIGNESVDADGGYFIFTWFPGMATLVASCEICMCISYQTLLRISAFMLVVYLITIGVITSGGVNCLNSTESIVAVVIVAIFVCSVELDVFLENRRLQQAP